MGNSASSSRMLGPATQTKYPLTPNSEKLLDGHYIGFYPSLDVGQINDICKSMDAVASITDLTIIIAGARSSKTKINSKYRLTTVQLNKIDPPNPPSEPADDKNATDSETQTEPGTTPTVPVPATPALASPATPAVPEPPTNPGVQNDFDIQLDSTCYLIIASPILLESADKDEILLKRSIDDLEKMCYIKIGSKYNNYIDSYFDAYITDDFKTINSSPNPANNIETLKIFLELPTISIMYLNFPSLRVFYNSRYSYVSVCEFTSFNAAMTHIKSVKNNANIMAIYFYKKSDKFLRLALQKFVYEEPLMETTVENEYYVFSVGHELPNIEEKTISFNGRKISLVLNKMEDFKLIKLSTDQKWHLKPKDISRGYELPKRIFSDGHTDNTTQIFAPKQVIQLNRRDFQLYIGYIEANNEVDIIGTILNSTNLPSNKFIINCNKDLFQDFTFPDGLYKMNNGFTNIPNLKNGINVSRDYYLTLGINENSKVDNYDIVCTDFSKLSVATLRNNHISSKQALLASHAGDMKNAGVYIPDSELIIPISYNDDKQLVIICAIDTNPNAVWNMAKNLLYKYERLNWVLYFSLIDKYTLGSCDKFTVLDHNNKMKILYPSNITLRFRKIDMDSFDILDSKNKQIFIFSQKYISATTRKQYIGAVSIYPKKVSSSISDYQQYKYSIVQNFSYIDYNIREVQIQFKDNFIGGMSNTLTIYSNMVTLPDPIIPPDSLNNNYYTFFDYLPTMNNQNVMKSYLKAFEEFLSRGSNSEIVAYTCLMRVRKEWVDNTKINKKYFEIITGRNPDYVLIFSFGGTKKRYTYNASKKTFTRPSYPSIIFDTEMAKSTTPSLKDIYIEDPLDAIVKPSDEINYINLNFNTSYTLSTSTVITYEPRDNISFFIREYSDLNSTLLLNGAVTQNDYTFTRETFIKQDWASAVYLFSTFLANETPVNTNTIILLNITTLEYTNIEINSLYKSIENFCKSIKNSPFKTFKVVYDRFNRIYIISNIDIIIDQKSDFYAFDYSRLYIKSSANPKIELHHESDDLLLDVINNKFIFRDNSNTYIRRMLTSRISIETPVTEYPQVDKGSRFSSGISVSTNSTFWKSVYAFIYIPNLSRLEVDNLVDMAKYLSVDLNQFFILTTVSYDSTTREKWMLDRCFVIRGNENNIVNISYKDANKTYYYIQINDGQFNNMYMKFAIWNSEQAPTNTDIEELDFVINKFTGTTYTSNIKIMSNERIGIAHNFFNFEFPDNTTKSFPKFIDFTLNINKYILFARPIQKDKLYLQDMKDGVAVGEITSTNNDEKVDFSDIINFIVQWYALSKNRLKRIIFFVNKHAVIKRPEKEYKIQIDKLIYNTSDFTYTNNSDVIIYPRNDDYNNINNTYIIDKNVSYSINNTADVNQLKHDSIVLYTGPPFKIYIGKKSNYKVLNEFTVSHLNMNILVHQIISKK